MSSEITLWEQQNPQLVERGLNQATWGALCDSIYPGAKQESVLMVWDYCRAQGLDPLLKPVHIVPMKVSTGQYDGQGKEIKAMRDTVLPGIGLYRINATRGGSYAGMSEPTFGPMIPMSCFRDNWSGPSSNRTKTREEYQIAVPEWCSITVTKMVGGVSCQFTAKEYWMENYAEKADGTPNTMWAKRPRAQLAKCTEAQALRKAFPEIGSQPTAEEMEGKHERDVTPQQPAQGAQQTQQTHTRTAAADERPAADQAEPKKPEYSDKTIEESLPTWRTAIEARRSTPEHLIARIRQKYTLTEAQADKIRQLQPLEGQVA
ncbi:phage recombination protein Bet [Pseudomonas sp. PS01301]|uniref:phage recombination protein Bet n=1 Tax=Pseudomonas sp. PS01301 TaxID=2991437 RepID=UPI00249BF5F6|nr:phage recombination protein Bet [Pseudomonas sp. PS01301]